MSKKPARIKKPAAMKKTQGSKTSRAAQQSFDDLSQEILFLLQEDGRRSFSSIARELGVSEGAVRSRVNYLEEHEHLRFLAVIDPVNVGYRCWAMLGIQVAAGVSPHEVALGFANNPNAIWVGVLGGEFDIMIEVWTKSSDELQQFLEDYCYTKRPLHNSPREIFLTISRYSESHNWRNSTSLVSDVAGFISVL